PRSILFPYTTLFRSKLSRTNNERDPSLRILSVLCVSALSSSFLFCSEVCMRRRVIAGNWKMFKTQAETRAFFAAFAPLVSRAKHCDMVIAPPFTAIRAAVEAARNTDIAISAQNLHWEKEGAFTGEISAAM